MFFCNPGELSVYVRGLPTNVTTADLEEEFKKFGRLKPNGVFIKNRKVSVIYCLLKWHVLVDTYLIHCFWACRKLVSASHLLNLRTCLVLVMPSRYINVISTHLPIIVILSYVVAVLYISCEYWVTWPVMLVVTRCNTHQMVNFNVGFEYTLVFLLLGFMSTTERKTIVNCDSGVLRDHEICHQIF